MGMVVHAFDLSTQGPEAVLPCVGQANQSYVVRLCDFVCFVFVLKHGFHEFKLLQVSFVYAKFCLEV